MSTTSLSNVSAAASERKVWLAYGITSLRIPAVHPYAGLEQREAFDAGRRAGPRVFIAGDPFDGSRVYYPGGVSITSDEQLERELERANTLGVDFFKTYVRLPDRLQKRIVDYAHDAGKPVTSHELYPAVAFGMFTWDDLGPEQYHRELDIEIDIAEPIGVLQIPAGKINLQRLFYWHVFKAYYRPDLTLDEMNHINFDWYAPKNAHRQSIEEVRAWCAEAGLVIERERVEDAGITIDARKVRR